MSAPPENGARIGAAHRRALKATGVLLALTGGVWMLAHYAGVLSPQIDGPALRSVMHAVLIGHGVIAYGAAILFGTLLARHIPAGLRRKKKPWSGIAGLALAALLIVSALLLYYAPNRELHDMASLAHQGFGVFAAAIVWRHVAARKRRPERRRR